MGMVKLEIKDNDGNFQDVSADILFEGTGSYLEYLDETDYDIGRFVVPSIQVKLDNTRRRFDFSGDFFSEIRTEFRLSWINKTEEQVKVQNSSINQMDGAEEILIFRGFVENKLIENNDLTLETTINLFHPFSIFKNIRFRDLPLINSDIMFGNLNINYFEGQFLVSLLEQVKPYLNVPANIYPLSDRSSGISLSDSKETLNCLQHLRDFLVKNQLLLFTTQDNLQLRARQISEIEGVSKHTFRAGSTEDGVPNLIAIKNANYGYKKIINTINFIGAGGEEAPDFSVRNFNSTPTFEFDYRYNLNNYLKDEVGGFERERFFNEFATPKREVEVVTTLNRITAKIFLRDIVNLDFFSIDFPPVMYPRYDVTRFDSVVFVAERDLTGIVASDLFKVIRRKVDLVREEVTFLIREVSLSG